MLFFKEGWHRLAVYLVIFLGVMALGSTCDSGDDDDEAPTPKGGVSGRVYLPDRLVLDTDTNDPNNPTVGNNDPATAQPLSNLVTVAGYVSSPTDPSDYYSVSLRAGEEVKLRIAETGPDLDLYLYQGATLIDASTSAVAQVEKVTVPADGNYFLEVHAFSDGSIYNLGVGVESAMAMSASAPPAPESEFVLGEAIVQFKTGGPAAIAGTEKDLTPAAQKAADRMGITLHALDPRGLAKVRFSLPPGMKSLSGALSSQSAKAGVDPLTLAKAKKATLDKIKELNQDPAVAFAEPNYIVHPTAFTPPNDPYYNLQWDLTLMRLPQAWEKTIGNSSVIVAVIDTGVLYNHPDLSANILRDGTKVVGYDMISDPEIAGDGNGVDSDPYDNGDKAFGSRSSFHGSHVAGTVAAATNNGAGIAGVAWQAKIMPVRVLGNGGGTYYDVTQGIYFAAGLDNAYHVFPKIGPTVTPAHIINMSLGSASSSSAVQNAISAARAAGVIVIAAAGNENSSALFYPAACAGVVGVSAVDLVARRAYYSNYGSYVDIAAPGGDMSADLNRDGNEDGILSTVADDSSLPLTYGYAFYQGTSMAAPHLAGVAVLMKTAFEAYAPGRTFTPQNLDDLIAGNIPNLDSITDYPKGYREPNKGYGLIDADKAVTAALILAGSTISANAQLSLSPSELAFGPVISQLTTYITNRGMEPLAGVTVLPYTVPWLSHQLSGFSLNFFVDRSSLDEGTYSAVITVSSQNGGTDSVKVSVAKQSGLNSDAGVIYVILYSPSQEKTVAQFETDAINLGNYYQLTKVAVGDYVLAAGTDLDNDGYIGDNGELFGLYPTLDQPQTVTLLKNTELVNRDFSLQFMGLPPSSSTAFPSLGQPLTFKRLR